MSGTLETRGVHVTDASKELIFERMQKADAKDINRQITGITVLRGCGALLGIVFLLINAYQGTWALMKLSGAAGGSLGQGAGQWDGAFFAGLSADQWIMGGTAFGLILAAQVIAIRLVMTEGRMKAIGVLILCGLMAFSVFTSAMHVGFNVEGGVIESTRASDEYKLAKKRLETAMSGQGAAQQRWSTYQNKAEQGTVAESGWMLRDDATKKYSDAISDADAELKAAQSAFDRVKETGGGSAMGAIVNVMSGWFGLSSAQFAMRFALFCVVLMELVRVYLSMLTGIYLMQVMSEMSASDKSKAAKVKKADPQPVADPEQAPKRAMPSTAAVSDSVSSVPRHVPMAPKKPDSQPKKQAADRTPDNKNQANYAKKLAALKAAVKSGVIPQGSVVGFDRVAELVGGNRKTVTALRNDLAAGGLAHWRGKRLFAGTE